MQYAIDEIIYAMCECRGNLYAVMKEILRLREGIDIGGCANPCRTFSPRICPRCRNAPA